MKTFTVNLETATTGDCSAINSILQRVDVEEAEKSMIERNNNKIYKVILLPYAIETIDKIKPILNKLNLHITPTTDMLNWKRSNNIRARISVNYGAKRGGVDCSSSYFINLNFCLETQVLPKYKINVYEPKVKGTVGSNTSFAFSKSINEDFTTIEDFIEKHSDEFEKFYRESLKLN